MHNADLTMAFSPRTRLIHVLCMVWRSDQHFTVIMLGRVHPWNYRFIRNDVYPVRPQSLSKAHYKAMVSLTIRIDFDAEGIVAGQRERVSWEFLWVRVAASETILGECAIINFECDVATWRVLIFEIDLMELWRCPWNLKWS